MVCCARCARARISANEPFFGGTFEALDGPGEGRLGGAGFDTLFDPIMGLDDNTVGLGFDPFIGRCDAFGLSSGRDG